MKRRLLNLLSGLSLLLCVAATVLWVWGWENRYTVIRGGAGTHFEVTTGDGRVAFYYLTDPSGVVQMTPPPGQWLAWRSDAASARVPEWARGVLGFGWSAHHPHPAIRRFRYLAVPLWPVCALAGLASLQSLMAIRRAAVAFELRLRRFPFAVIAARRRRIGLCPS
jgi:hypothetical protein